MVSFNRRNWSDDLALKDQLVSVQVEPITYGVVLLHTMDIRVLSPRLFLSPVNDESALNFHVFVHVIPLLC